MIKYALEIGKIQVINNTLKMLDTLTGSAVTRITSRVHDVPMKLAALPLLFEANLQALRLTESLLTHSLTSVCISKDAIFICKPCRVEQCKENLKQLSEVSDESDDLRAQALMDCCRFDALLEIGMLFMLTEGSGI